MGVGVGATKSISKMRNKLKDGATARHADRLAGADDRTFANKRIDDLYNTSLPNLAADVERVSTALVVQTLDIDVHHRKWALTLQGLKHKSPNLGNVPHK